MNKIAEERLLSVIEFIERETVMDCIAELTVKGMGGAVKVLEDKFLSKVKI